MKRKITKIMAVILTAIMVMSICCSAIVPGTNTTAQSTEPRGEVWPLSGDISMKNDGSSVRYNYDPDTAVLSFTGYGNMRDIIAEEFSMRPWMDATTVIFEEGIARVSGSLMYNCSRLQTVVLPSTIKGLYNGSFSNCTSLETITLPANIGFLGRLVFYGCSNLREIIMPPTVSTKINEVSGGVNDCESEQMYMYCSSLQEIYVPGGIKHLGENYAYSSGVEKVTIEEGTETIGAYAFANTPIRMIYLPQSITSIESTAFSNRTSSSFAIYGVPGSYAQSFANANGYRFYDVASNPPEQEEVDVRWYNGSEFHDSRTLNVGDLIPNIQAPVKTGYTFYGWYDNENCIGNPYDFEHVKIYKNTYLYAKFCSDTQTTKKINYNTDVFSFPNPEYKHKLQAAYGMHISLQQSRWEKFLKEAYKYSIRNSGSCFGMSSLVILAKTGKIDLPYYKVNNLAEFKDPLTVSPTRSKKNYVEWNTTQLINYYQVQQKVGHTKDAVSNYSGNEMKNIKKLVQTLMASNEPVMFTVDLYVDGRKQGGHALVAHDCVQEPDGSYLISYWDPNSVIYENEATVPADFSEMSMNGSEDNFVKATIIADQSFNRYKLTDEMKKRGCYYDGRNTTSSKEPRLTNEDFLVKSSSYLTTNYKSFTVTSTNGQTATVTNDELTSGSNTFVECLGLNNEVGEETEYLFRLPDLASNEKYTITQVAEEGITEYKTFFEKSSTSVDGAGAYSSMEANGSVTFDSNGGVETVTATAAKQTAASVLNNATNDTLTQFTATTTGLKAYSVGNSAKANTADNCNITVKTFDESGNAVEATGSVNGSGDTVTVTEANGTVTYNSANPMQTQVMPFTAMFETGTASSPDAQTGLKAGDKLAVPDVINPGYTVNWYRNAERTGTPWNFETDTVSGDITLYANWVTDSSNKCTITYYIDGQSYISRSTEKWVADVDFFNPPQREGRMFTGWYLDSDCTIPATRSTVFEENTILYAGWKQIGTMAVENDDTAKVFGNDSSYDEFGLSGLQMKILTGDNTDSYGNGLRFCLTVSKSLYNSMKLLYGDTVEYGNLVALKSKISSLNEMTFGAANVSCSPSNKIFYNGSTYNVATTLVYNIPASAYKADIVVRPYIKYTDRNGREQVYYFTETQEGSVHAKGYSVSMYKAANFILDNDSASYNNEQIAYLQSVANAE